MKTIFKVVDKVYCVISGHGVIKNIYDTNPYPIEISFNKGNEFYYTLDGRFYGCSNPTLSFTEYTLQGFSQERPIELPEVGELCLVRDSKQTVWQVGFFKEYRNNNEFPFVTDIRSWKEMKRIKILD